ncbi:hypothetical protein RT97_28915, partial [Variovorax paradoxus]
KGGQTSIELDGMNITLKMPGLLDVKGASKSFVGPKGSPAQLPALPVGSAELTESRLDQGPYKADYQLFKTDNRPFELYAYEIHGRYHELLKSGDTSKAGQTSMVNSEVSIGLKGYKSIMRESERVTENWSSVLDSKAREAETRSALALNGGSESEAA